MTEQEHNPQGGRKRPINRENRYPSHALIELRKYKHLPFGVHSAVLLDISLGGFKVEFTGEMRARPGEAFWIHIPLPPLGITAPVRIMCKGECRWFDSKKFRLGGIFTQLSKTDRHILEQVIESLRKRGSLSV